MSFARQGGPGAKFKSALEKMMKSLTLPKGAKEELNYPSGVADKILNGEPLWDEEPKDGEKEADGDEMTSNKTASKQLT